MNGPQPRRPDGSGRDDDGRGGFASFEDFYNRTFDALLARARMLERDRDRAEQAIADTYVEAYSSWERIENPWGWALTVMTHRLARISWRDRLRLAKEQRIVEEQQRFVEVPMPAGMLPEEWAEVALVRRAVAQLPRRERQVVILYYLCDLTQAQIATVLGISRGSVARYLSDALHRLQRMLGAVPPPAGPGEQLAPRPAPAGTAAGVAEAVAVRLMAVAVWLAEGSRADGQARERVRQKIAQQLPGVWEGGQR